MGSTHTVQLIFCRVALKLYTILHHDPKQCFPLLPSSTPLMPGKHFYDQTWVYYLAIECKCTFSFPAFPLLPSQNTNISSTLFSRPFYNFQDWKAEEHSYPRLYNNPSYSRILIGSCLWSIRGQMHDWRHHYRVFASVVLKWRKVLRIRIIFYVTGQIIRYKKVLPSHWTSSRSKKTKDKAVFFRKW